MLSFLGWIKEFTHELINKVFCFENGLNLIELIEKNPQPSSKDFLKKIKNYQNMSAVGTDAAFMLEKALEEMDDIFKAEEIHHTSHHAFIQQDSSTPIHPTQTTPTSSKSSRRTENSKSLIKLLDEMEFLLSGQLDSGESFMKSDEKGAILNYCRKLSFVSLFLKELFAGRSPNSKVNLSSFVDFFF